MEGSERRGRVIGVGKIVCAYIAEGMLYHVQTEK